MQAQLTRVLLFLAPLWARGVAHDVAGDPPGPSSGIPLGATVFVATPQRPSLVGEIAEGLDFGRSPSRQRSN